MKNATYLILKSLLDGPKSHNEIVRSLRYQWDYGELYRRGRKDALREINRGRIQKQIEDFDTESLVFRGLKRMVTETLWESRASKKRPNSLIERHKDEYGKQVYYLTNTGINKLIESDHDPTEG